MPSEKRARQRAMREVRQAEVAKGRRRRRLLRRAIAALFVVALVVALVAVLSASNTSKDHAATTTTTVATTTTTNAATAAIAPTCPPASGAAARHLVFSAAPGVCIDETATYLATVETDVGTFTITLDAAASPAAVNNFVFLARYHFYDGTKFFRVIPNGILQGGDALDNDGDGGPGYSWTGNTPTGCTDDCYPIGSVATANTGTPSTNGSQFFIVAGSSGTSYPPNYTLFGKVTSGMSVVDAIAADGNSANAYAPKVTHHIVKVTITEES